MKNLGQMMKQAQAMQSKMAEMQESLSNFEIAGTSGGGTLTNDLLNRATGSSCDQALTVPPPFVPAGFPNLPDSPASPGPAHSGSFSATYTAMGQQLTMNLTITDPNDPGVYTERDHAFIYDDLGKTVNNSKRSGAELRIAHVGAFTSLRL